MSDRWTVGLAIALGWIAIIVLRRKGERMREREAWQPPAGAAPRRSKAPDDEIDRATLEEAEREARDLPPDLKGRHEEDALGEDWGPGTPKPPYI